MICVGIVVAAPAGGPIKPPVLDIMEIFDARFFMHGDELRAERRLCCQAGSPCACSLEIWANISSTAFAAIDCNSSVVRF